MKDKYKITIMWRMLSASLCVASFALIIIHFFTKGIFNGFEIAILMAIGILFLSVAVRGKSPKWIEEDLKIFPEKDKSSHNH